MPAEIDTGGPRVLHCDSNQILGPITSNNNINCGNLKDLVKLNNHGITWLRSLSCKVWRERKNQKRQSKCNKSVEDKDDDKKVEKVVEKMVEMESIKSIRHYYDYTMDNNNNKSNSNVNNYGEIETTEQDINQPIAQVNGINQLHSSYHFNHSNSCVFHDTPIIARLLQSSSSDVNNNVNNINISNNNSSQQSLTKNEHVINCHNEEYSGDDDDDGNNYWYQVGRSENKSVNKCNIEKKIKRKNLERTRIIQSKKCSYLQILLLILLIVFGHSRIIKSNVFNIVTVGTIIGVKTVVKAAPQHIETSSTNITGSRSERSPQNLSSVTGTSRKILMYINKHFLQILPNGSITGTDHFSDYAIFQRGSAGLSQVKFRGIATCLYLCMDSCGILYSSRKYTDDCAFVENIQANNYNVYSSRQWSTPRRTLYIALNRFGQPRKLQVRGRNLGRLSNYARTMTPAADSNQVKDIQSRVPRGCHKFRHHHNASNMNGQHQSSSSSSSTSMQNNCRQQQSSPKKSNGDTLKRKKRKKRKKEKKRCDKNEKTSNNSNCEFYNEKDNVHRFDNINSNNNNNNSNISSNNSNKNNSNNPNHNINININSNNNDTNNNNTGQLNSSNKSGDANSNNKSNNNNHKNNKNEKLNKKKDIKNLRLTAGDNNDKQSRKSSSSEIDDQQKDEPYNGDDVDVDDDMIIKQNYNQVKKPTFFVGGSIKSTVPGNQLAWRHHSGKIFSSNLYSTTPTPMWIKNIKRPSPTTSASIPSRNTPSSLLASLINPSTMDLLTSEDPLMLNNDDQSLETSEEELELDDDLDSKGSNDYGIFMTTMDTTPPESTEEYTKTTKSFLASFEFNRRLVNDLKQSNFHKTNFSLDKLIM